MIGRCTHVVDCRATGGMGKGGGLAQRGTFAECGAEVLAVAMSPGRRHITKPVCEITFGLRESNVLTSTMVLNAGAGVHGHSLRLDENGLMFDMLRRQVFNKETGNVEMVRDQIGVDLDEPVVLGEPLDEETLKSKTTIYRIDGEAYKDDTEAVEVLKNIHVSRSFGAFNPVKGWD